MSKMAGMADSTPETLHLRGIDCLPMTIWQYLSFWSYKVSRNANWCLQQSWLQLLFYNLQWRAKSQFKEIILYIDYFTYHHLILGLHHEGQINWKFLRCDYSLTRQVDVIMTTDNCERPVVIRYVDFPLGMAYMRKEWKSQFST